MSSYQYSTIHVSGAGAVYFPLSAQTYFCDFCSPLRSMLRDLPLPLPLPLQWLFSHPLIAPLSLTRFSARSTPAQMFQEANQGVSQKVNWFLADRK